MFIVFSVFEIHDEIKNVQATLSSQLPAHLSERHKRNICMQNLVADFPKEKSWNLKNI